MRFLLATTVAVGLSLAGWTQARADDEVKGPVPSRADPSDPGTDVYRATAVIGMPVRDAAGEEIGHIKDLVINGNTSEVLYAVLSMNGSKGREVVYIMPWTVFQPAYGNGLALQYVTLGVPQNVWVQAPSFGVTQWQQTSFTSWAPRVNTYFSKYVTQTGNGATTVPGAASRRTNSGAPDRLKSPGTTKPQTPAASDSDEAAAEKPTTPKAKTSKSPAPKASDDGDSKDPAVKEPAPKRSAPKEAAPKPDSKEPAAKEPAPKSSSKDEEPSADSAATSPKSKKPESKPETPAKNPSPSKDSKEPKKP